MSMRSVRRGLNYRISSCNFIADWMIVMWKLSIVCLALATSELATTYLPERSHQPGLDFIFSFGKKSVIRGSYQHSWFTKWPFLHYNEAVDTVICHSCMKMFKEKKNKTSTKADPAFVSSAFNFTIQPIISKIIMLLPIIVAIISFLRLHKPQLSFMVSLTHHK